VAAGSGSGGAGGGALADPFAAPKTKKGVVAIKKQKQAKLF